jgi:hypothetical protein
MADLVCPEVATSDSGITQTMVLYRSVRPILRLFGVDSEDDCRSLNLFGSCRKEHNAKGAE